MDNFAASVSVSVAQVIGFIAYFAPYFAIAFAARMATGIIGNIAGFVNDRHRGAFDRVKNFRNNARATRSKKFQSGSLFQDRGVGGLVNRLGTSVGAFNAGGGMKSFSPFAQGRNIRAMYGDNIGEQALKDNPLLNQLQNNDQANNILALSGGTKNGLRQAADDLGLTGNDRRVAMRAALAVGVNRRNALAAFKSSSHNKWRGVGAGDIQSIDRGIRRLANSQEEYYDIAEGVSAVNRGNGRGDLGGRAHISWNRDNAAWTAARAATGGAVTAATWENMADRTLVDAYGRMTLQQTHGGHDNQAIQAARTFARQLYAAAPGSTEARDAARNLYELSQHQFSSGTGRDRFNEVLYGPAFTPAGAPTGSLRLDANQTHASLSQQLSLAAETGVASALTRDVMAGGGASVAGVPTRPMTPNELAATGAAPGTMTPVMSQYEYALTQAPAVLVGGAAAAAQQVTATGLTTTGRVYPDPRNTPGS